MNSLSQNDMFLEALLLLHCMVLEAIKPNGVTIASILPACSHLELFEIGKQLRAYALRHNILIENFLFLVLWLICIAIAERFLEIVEFLIGS